MKKLICFALIMASAQVMAAVVTLSSADTLGQSSFNSGLHWSNGLAPSAGNTYEVSIAHLRTPANSGTYTFGGDSLTINPGGVLFYKGTGSAGSITIQNFFANGGTIMDHRNGSGDVCNLYGTIYITADSIMSATQGPINVYATISGGGTITNPLSDNEACRLTFYSADSTFTGHIVNNGRFALAENAVLNFVIGADGVNNSVSGTGTAAFDGVFNFDLSSADTNPRGTWTITNVATQSFGSTFTVAGFTNIDGNLWTKEANGISYQFSQSTGLLTSFYPISTPEQLNAIGTDPSRWNKHFVLMADIDMSAYTGTQYNIIGNETTPFSGTFDGNGHVISNLTIQATSYYYVGLFGYIGEGGQVCNLGVENVSIYGYSAVGGLAGLNNSGTLTACYVTGTVSAGESYAGGLVGYNYSGTLTACYATGTVSGWEYVGGLTGFNHFGTITACFWDTQTSGQSFGVGFGSSAGAVGKTTGEMKKLSTFTSAEWDFANVWGIGNGQTYPYLKSYNGINPADINYSGTVDLEDLAILAANWLNN